MKQKQSRDLAAVKLKKKTNLHLRFEKIGHVTLDIKVSEFKSHVMVKLQIVLTNIPSVPFINIDNYAFDDNAYSANLSGT